MAAGKQIGIVVWLIKIIKFGWNVTDFQENMTHLTWGTIVATDGSAPACRRGICGHNDGSGFTL